MSKELSDKTSRGKERPWKKHKLQNEKVINALNILYYLDRARRIAGCGSSLVFEACLGGHEKRLKEAYFCRDRVCSMCIWRKSLFVFAQFLLVAHKVLELYPKIMFLFQTLTLRNCPPDKLSDTLTHLNKSYTRYSRRKRIRNAFKGVFRTLETTYNPLSNTFHPHIHSIVLVGKNYFTKGYIRHAELQQLWRKSLQVDYKPDCWIERVKPKKKDVSTVYEEIWSMEHAMFQDALAGAGAEVAKYSTKIGDIVDPKIKKEDSFELVRAKIALREDSQWQARVLDYLMRGLSGRRLICYTGIFKEAYQALKCKDVEDSDLINMPGDEEKTCRCKVCKSELVQLHYVWNGMGYFERSQGKETHINLNHKNKKGRKEDGNREETL